RRSGRERRARNRAPVPLSPSAIQNEIPSLQAPNGVDPAPVERDPMAERSAAFQSETLAPVLFVTRTRRPSNAATMGPSRPFPVRVRSRTPVEARTTETEFEVSLGTQMFVPSNTGRPGTVPTVTVWRIAPPGLNRNTLPAFWSVTQMLVPSHSAPLIWENPVVTVVTVQGTVGATVAIETEPVPTDPSPKFAVQIRAPS